MFFFWAPTCQATPKPRLERFDTARTCDAAINPVRDTECSFRLVATGAFSWKRGDGGWQEGNVDRIDIQRYPVGHVILRDVLSYKLIMWLDFHLKLETTGLWYCFDLIWRESSTYLPSSSFFIFCEAAKLYIFLNIHRLSLPDDPRMRLRTCLSFSLSSLPPLSNQSENPWTLFPFLAWRNWIFVPAWLVTGSVKQCLLRYSTCNALRLALFFFKVLLFFFGCHSLYSPFHHRGAAFSFGQVRSRRA